VAAINAAAAAAQPGDTVLVTGSIFLVGAVRAHLTGEPTDTAVPL
jgi:folylpolyglutamate synthase/dihydropteroate synthase